jgi:hypothetical protein
MHLWAVVQDELQTSRDPQWHWFYGDSRQPALGRQYLPFAAVNTES